MSKLILRFCVIFELIVIVARGAFFFLLEDYATLEFSFSVYNYNKNETHVCADFFFLIKR